MENLSLETTAICRLDLLEFTKNTFLDRRQEFYFNWHHSEIAYVLQEVFVGNIKNLIINIPPRHGKTEMVVSRFIPWALGNSPRSQFINISYGATTAKENNTRVRDVINSESYKQIFRNVNIAIDFKGKSHWKTDAGGIVYCAGKDGALIGFGAGGISKTNIFLGALIADDLQKTEDINSFTYRKNSIDNFERSIKTRKNADNCPMVIIQQRLHENDLSGHFLKKKGESKWDRLILKAYDEKKQQALWPVVMPIEELKLKKIEAPLVFNAEYQQEPLADGGGIFKEEWWKRYTELPPLEYTFIVADTASKKGVRNDPSAFGHYGVLGKYIYVLNCWGGKLDSTELEEEIYRFYYKELEFLEEKGLSAQIRAIHIENKSSGTDLILRLRKDYFQKGKKNLPLPPIEEINPIKSREWRVENNKAYLAAGQVLLPDSCYCKNGGFVNSYVEEHTKYTHNATSGHDEKVDLTIYAIDIALKIKKNLPRSSELLSY